MRHATIKMVAETQAHAAWIWDLGMRPDETIGHILRPVEAELIARYGHDVGGRLNREFLKAFGAFGAGLIEDNGRRRRETGPTGETTGSPEPRVIFPDISPKITPA